MLHHLLSYDNQSNTKVSSITLKVCLHFVQKSRRFCVDCNLFWIFKKETPSHQNVNIKLISTEVCKQVCKYISFIFIQVFHELRKFDQWLTSLMNVSRFAVIFFLFLFVQIQYDFPNFCQIWLNSVSHWQKTTLQSW